MKLADWAREQGLDYKTAYRWFRAGILPVPAEQLVTGTILVYPTKKRSGQVALYARVSSQDQKRDLERQIARLAQYASENRLHVAKVISEIGSGLNGKRPKLLSVLRDGDMEAIVVEHLDRLMRFGIEYVEAALTASGRRLVVVDESEMTDDLVREMIEVLVSFCARLYGRRSARNKAKKALKALQVRTEANSSHTASSPEAKLRRK